MLPACRVGDSADGACPCIPPSITPATAPAPLQPATGSIDAAALVAPHGLSLPAVPPLLHFARGVDVVVWSPRRV
ncbi:MAG: hypothetical protein DWI05_04105 [Planctomycetota bacterium]|nr:MAG: hypothetical protein DWI05_04105 [Planctomycetota bacterium]